MSTLLQRCKDMGLDAEILEAVRDGLRLRHVVEHGDSERSLAFLGCGVTHKTGECGHLHYFDIKHARNAIDAAMQQEQQQ